MPATTAKPARVFISYTHESEEHSRRVLDLADSLMALGIKVYFDRYDPHPSEPFPLWMTRHLMGADAILMVCTATYHARSLEESTGRGGGVPFEGNLILNMILARIKLATSFIPILLGEEPEASIPIPVRGNPQYRLRGFNLGDPEYEALYRKLTDQPSTPEPKPGEVVKLPPESRRYAATAPPAESAAMPSCRTPLPRGESDALCKALESLRQEWFELVLLTFRVPAKVIPSPPELQSHRVGAFMKWAEDQEHMVLPEVKRFVETIFSTPAPLRESDEGDESKAPAHGPASPPPAGLLDPILAETRNKFIAQLDRVTEAMHRTGMCEELPVSIYYAIKEFALQRVRRHGSVRVVNILSHYETSTAASCPITGGITAFSSRSGTGTSMS